ncbi:MAG: ABC transporter ATP-binding protein [Nitrososphaerota archaeon]
MTEILLENVSKYIKGKTVLNNINLRVQSADVAVLLGPAGAGKTTLLRIIAGTEKPDKGRIYFDGKDVTDLPPQKRDVGMVFQTFALYPNMSVYENIASPLRIRKLPEAEINKKVKEVAELLNITHILSKKPHECSGGEAQRTVIARAIVKRPKIYLFDEPLTNLDYKVREVLRLELKKIFNEVRSTVLYSTSNPEEAAALGKTLIHIREGRIIQTGPIKDCFRKPADINAALYYSPVGVNIFNSKCLRVDSRKYLHVNSVLKFDVTDVEQVQEGKEYMIGIYPHSIKLFKLASENKLITIPIDVDFVENMGSELVVVTKCGEHIMTILSSEVERLHEIKDLKYAYVPPNEIMIFSKDGGEYLQTLER